MPVSRFRVEVAFAGEGNFNSGSILYYTANVKSNWLNGKGLDINAKEAAQNELERMAGHLGDDVRNQTDNGFPQQPFDVAAGTVTCRLHRDILHFIEGTFNAFTQAVEPAVKVERVLDKLIGPFRGPDAIALEVELFLLPVFTEETLVAEDVAVPDDRQDRFGGQALIAVGRHQLIGDRDAIQGGQQEQFTQ